MPSLLQDILHSTRQEVRRRERSLSQDDLKQSQEGRNFQGSAQRWQRALERPGINIIAEFKRRSPSAGALSGGSSLENLVSAYERGGAQALSILTEERYFDGRLADLHAARATSRLPILRKDFITTPYQLYESKAADVDAVLLIVCAMAPKQLCDLFELAGELDLGVLVEAHEAHELELALSIGAKVVGINSRNLTTLDVDFQRALDLLSIVPEGVCMVAESGLREPKDLLPWSRAGVHNFLIGEALLRSDNPELLLREMRALA